MRNSLLLVLIISFIFSWPFVSRPLRAEEGPAQEFRIAKAKGPAGMIPASSRRASPAKEGVLLLAGDRLITGKGGQVQIATKEGTVLEIQEESNLLIEELTGKINLFFLKIGRLLARVASLKETKTKTPTRFKTPVAVASIRGTELALAVDESQELQAGVIEGEVQFDKEDTAEVALSTVPSKEQVIVEASKGLVVKPKQPMVKTNEIPPLLVGSLDWFPAIRAQIPALKEQWKDLDFPSQIKFRQGALRETITWHVPKKLGLGFEPPSKIMERKKLSPDRVKPSKQEPR